MSRWVKGFLLWVINNVLAIMTMDSFLVFLKTFSRSSFLRFLLFGLPWIISGSIIVVAFASTRKAFEEALDDECKEIRNRISKNTPLAYTFINNSVLLSSETIRRNGFIEIWRQENDEHSIQILCFNSKTGQFQAFDRFHWMDDPCDTTNLYSSCIRDGKGHVMTEPWVEPVGMHYRKDLWIPIALHYTEEWVKKHIR